MEKMTAVAILRAFFKLPQPPTLKELQALGVEVRHELAELAAIEMGVELAGAPAKK